MEFRVTAQKKGKTELAHGIVKSDKDYEKSLLLATQTAAGSAKMVMNRGEIPVQTLIDNVATKGGCTRVGVDCMDDNNTENLFYNVIKSTTEKAHDLGN